MHEVSVLGGGLAVQRIQANHSAFDDDPFAVGCFHGRKGYHSCTTRADRLDACFSDAAPL